LPDANQAEQLADAIHQHMKSMGMAVGQQVFNQFGDEYLRKAIPKIQQTSPETFMVSSQSKFFKNENLLWGDVDPFQQAFGRVFVTYRELIHDNDRLEKYPPLDDPTRRHRSTLEFQAEFGSPPWEFVNQILEECRLDFRVDSPPLYEIVAYEPKLRKLSTKVEMRFQDLSSGEKVLMSFALCMYNVQDHRQAKTFPKLLLLDEIDAPLHPSMVASLLRTIQNVLIREKNVAVILTTHSPSTVALAPEAAIYSMNPLGPKIEKISKSSALSILTEGVPTLAVSFDGRRQVFVESNTDARIYEKLYQNFKAHLTTERSLVFVKVGHLMTSGGERNAGCEQVKRIVESLSNGGNNSVRGLIDWDGNRTSEEKIHVLSEGIRDGIESLIFDPVLLVTTLIKENRKECLSHGIIEPDDTYLLINLWTRERWQKAIEKLLDLIIPNRDLNGQRIKISYLNSMTLEIDQHYLHLDDHALEKEILDTFKFLRARSKHTGDLAHHIIDSALVDYPQLVPKDLLTTFEGLLS
jgi:hypothetical protein